MEKTCRACNKSVMEPRCYYHAKRFCYTAEDCPHWGERETPLLVDALAKAAQDLAMSISMDMVNIAADGGWTKQEASEVVEAWEAVRQVYHRYQEEVGNDKA